MTNGWKKLHAGCCAILATLRRGRIRSEDGPGPVNNVEAILDAAANCFRHVQVFGAQKWAVEADTALAVVDLTKKHCLPDAWTTAPTRPKSATAHGLKKLGVEPVGMFSPRFYGSERIEVVARVQIDSLEKVLRGSGEFGIFSRPFFIEGELRVYKTSRRLCGKPSRLGPPRMGSSCAARVSGCEKVECDFESVLGQVYTEEDHEVNRRKMNIFPSREDQERHCPVSGAASPSQIAARLLVRAHLARGATQASTSAGLGVVKAGENHGGEPESCKILGKCCPGRLEESQCHPCTRHASSGSETPSRRRQSMDTTDVGAISRSGAGLQPGAYSVFDLSTNATVGYPAASSLPSAGRYYRAAPVAHGIHAVDCDHCRTARWPDAVPSSRGHRDKERRQRARRAPRARRFLFRAGRGRGGHCRGSRRAKVPIYQICAVLSHLPLAREEVPG